MSRFDEHLDTTIDHIARTMTTGSPDASFTARVMARIENERPSAYTFAWRAAWVGAVAVVIAAVVILWPRTRENAATISQQAATTRPAPVVLPDRNRARTDRSQHARSIAPRGDARLAAATATAPGASSSSPAPIEITPVNVDPLSLAAVGPPHSIQPNVLEPLAPIAVTPLGDDPERRWR